jgi:CBS domain containing-hemolysin-like protein
MTPFHAVITARPEDSVEAALTRCASWGHTRLLVVEGDRNDLGGVVHDNVLAAELMRRDGSTPIRSLVTPAYVVRRRNRSTTSSPTSSESGQHSRP